MQRRALPWLLLASVILNVVMAVLWLVSRPVERPQRPEVTIVRSVVTNLFRPIRTNLVFQPRLLSWQELESTNYTIFIANLRGFGCPEETVRDIIVADVNQVFSERRAADVLSPTSAWWRAEADSAVDLAAQHKLEELDWERRLLLTQLLGPGWENPGRHFESPFPLPALDGPVLGSLPAATKGALYAVEAAARAERRHLEEAAAQEGRELTPAERAQLDRHRQAQLAQVLGPAELEEYSLRASPYADRLRDQFRSLEPTQEEFRSLYRATDAIATELAELADKTDVASVQRRTELEAKRDQAIRDALGPDRFAYLQLTQQPGFLEARATALRLGVGAEAVVPLYQINEAAAQETRRVLGDRNLTADEQMNELALLQAQRLETLRQLLGDDAFRRLQAQDGH